MPITPTVPLFPLSYAPKTFFNLKLLTISNLMFGILDPKCKLGQRCLTAEIDMRGL
jgi:hypothetical protein